jgi:hypothetical protein
MVDDLGGTATAGEVGDGVVTVAHLQAQCETVLRAIVAEGGSRAECEANAPLQFAEEKDAERWLVYLTGLHRRHALLAGGSVAAGASAGSGGDQLSAALADALAEEAVAVEFADGEIRYVHPKSFHALAWLDSLDRQHQRGAQAAAAAAEMVSGGLAPNVLAEATELNTLLALAPLASSLSVRLWLWILTNEAPGLPFDEAVKDAEPPAWTLNVTPQDLLKVYEAHLKVNQERLGIIARAFPSDGRSESRLPLVGFIGVIASENGQDAKLLMRRHSLGKLFATSVSATEASRAAHEAAKKRRD